MSIFDCTLVETAVSTAQLQALATALDIPADPAIVSIALNSFIVVHQQHIDAYAKIAHAGGPQLARLLADHLPPLDGILPPNPLTAAGPLDTINNATHVLELLREFDFARVGITDTVQDGYWLVMTSALEALKFAKDKIS